MTAKKATANDRDIEFKQPVTAFEPIMRALGKRMKDTIERVAAQKNVAPKEIEILMCESVGVLDANKFSRWYKGNSIKKIAEMAVMLQELERVRGEPVDLRYLLYGTEPGKKNKHDEIIERLDRNYSALRYFSDYFRDHELGLEGIVMRHGVRMVQEIRAARRPFDPDGDHSKSREPFLAGFLHDWHSELLESCSTTTRLALLGLDYGIELRHEQHEGTEIIRPGRFFDVVAENLNQGRKYEYLFPGTSDQWAPIIGKYLAVLESEGHVPNATLHDNLSFYVTEQPLGAGFILLDIDSDQLASKSLFLLQEIQKDYLTEGNQIGTLSTASVKTHGCALMDPDRTQAANTAWLRYMETATKIG